MCKAMTRAYRHGGHGHAGRLDRGWIRVADSARLFGVSESWLRHAVQSELHLPKQRVELDPTEEWVHALQGHSSDSGITDPAQVYEECTLRSMHREGISPFSRVFHGTELSRVDGIVRFGLLAGGGRLNNRLTCHWVVSDHPPRQGENVKGFRSDSTVVVETTLQSLWDTGVRVYHGAPGVLLTTDVAPEGLCRILGLTEGSTEFGLEVASYSPTDRVLKLLDQSGAHVDAPEPAPEGEEQELPEGDTEESSDDDTPRGPAVAAEAEARPSGSAETAGSSAPGQASPEATAKAAEPSSSAGNDPSEAVAEEEPDWGEENTAIEIAPPSVAVEPPPPSLPLHLWARDGRCLLCKGNKPIGDVHNGTRKDHEERKRARQRTVLDMALSAARWTCQRCQEQNLLRRWKCYKCSARRKRKRDAEDSSESDSERERRIQELHDSVAPRKQRKRGGQRQRLAAKGKGKEKSKGKQKGKGRKKVCRRCRGTHTKPCSRAGRPRQKGVRVKFPMSPGVILSFYRKWRLHLPGKARNKRCHALTGNGLRVAEVCRLLGLLSLVPLALRTEQEAEEVIMTASSYAQRTILELEEVSVEAVRVSGRVLIAAILTVGIVALWFVGRLIANRVMRAGHGTIRCLASSSNSRTVR